MTREESSETRIALLENNQNNLMDKLDDLISRFDKFDEKLDKALEKKANIWVEKAFTWLLYTVAGILVAAFMYLIIKFKI